MINKKYLLILGLVAQLGCSKWNQDPMKESGIAEAAGLPSPEAIQKPGEHKQVIFWDTEDVQTFFVEEQGEMKISARLAQPSYTLKIMIENIDEFPGAVYDQKTGMFSWKPNVKSLPEEVESYQTTLKVSGSATSPTMDPQVEKKNIVIKVERKLQLPQVISLKAVDPSYQGYLREGELTRFFLTVRDPDAGISTSTWPQLAFGAPSESTSNLNLVPFTTIEDVNADGVGNFTFKINVDLRDQELTTSDAVGGLAVSAVSQFKKQSALFSQNWTVYSNLSAATTNWNQQFSAVQGESINQNFMIFNPKGETEISVLKIENLPKGAQMACKNATAYSLGCFFTWATSSTDFADYYAVKVTVRIKNTASADKVTQDQEFLLRFRLKKALNANEQE